MTARHLSENGAKSLGRPTDFTVSLGTVPPSTISESCDSRRAMQRILQAISVKADVGGDFLANVSPALSRDAAIVQAFQRLLGAKRDQYAENDDADLAKRNRASRAAALADEHACERPPGGSVGYISPKASGRFG